MYLLFAKTDAPETRRRNTSIAHFVKCRFSGPDKQIRPSVASFALEARDIRRKTVLGRERSFGSPSFFQLDRVCSDTDFRDVFIWQRSSGESERSEDCNI